MRRASCSSGGPSEPILWVRLRAMSRVRGGPASSLPPAAVCPRTRHGRPQQPPSPPLRWGDRPQCLQRDSGELGRKGREARGDRACQALKRAHAASPQVTWRRPSRASAAAPSLPWPRPRSRLPRDGAPARAPRSSALAWRLSASRHRRRTLGDGAAWRPVQTEPRQAAPRGWGQPPPESCPGPCGAHAGPGFRCAPWRRRGLSGDAAAWGPGAPKGTFLAPAEPALRPRRGGRGRVSPAVGRSPLPLCRARTRWRMTSQAPGSDTFPSEGGDSLERLSFLRGRL